MNSARANKAHNRLTDTHTHTQDTAHTGQRSNLFRMLNRSNPFARHSRADSQSLGFRTRSIAQGQAVQLA